MTISSSLFRFGAIRKRTFPSLFTSICLASCLRFIRSKISQHGCFNALMRFNGKLATVLSWQEDGDRDYNSVTLKTQQWRGNVAVLSQTPYGDSVRHGIRFSRLYRLPDIQMLDGRRGVERKSSFNVCLNDFEWEKLDERDSP